MNKITEKIITYCRYRHNLWNMSRLYFKARYSNAFLGVLLIIVNPLLLVLAITFVFRMVFNCQIHNFSAFILSGLFPWMFFSNSLSEAAFSILSQQNILRQFTLPREFIPISVVFSNFFCFLIGWFVLYPFFIFLNFKVITLFPFLLIVVLFEFMFVIGLSLMVSVANVFFRDIGHLLGTILMFWIWVTPIFYSIDMMPEKIRWLIMVNPIQPYVLAYQEILFKGLIPSWNTFFAIFVLSSISFFSGIFVFGRFESKLLKYI